MAAGGYIYEKETATYSSTTFDTLLKWGLHIFRKQIYAFLKAATRSATVNGDAHQYWDFDTTRTGLITGNTQIALDDDQGTSGIAPVHTDAEWQAVSEVMTDGSYAANDIVPIFSYGTNAAYPAFGCFFVGKGGEHLFFSNSVAGKKASDTVSGHTNYMSWYYEAASSASQNKSVLKPDLTGSAYPLYSAGFTVIFSPSDDFYTSNPANSGFRPPSATMPTGVCFKRGTQSSDYILTTTNNKSVIGAPVASEQYTFGFVVKRDQVIYMTRTESFASDLYKFLFFGTLIDECIQSGDTHKQTSFVLNDGSGSETTTSTLSGDYPFRALYLDNYYNFFIDFANADGACEFVNILPASGTTFSYNVCPAFGATASVSSDKIPYCALYLYVIPKITSTPNSNPLIKDGYGAKGYISTDVLRVIPFEKNSAGSTFESGKFFCPRPFPISGSANFTQQTFMIGWDPSNEL